LLFINFSSFKPDTEKNANFDAVSSKRANFDEVQFLKHIPKLIIFGTHNLYTNGRQFITEFPDKGWTKNCVNKATP